jgi:hypothetical protein
MKETMPSSFDNKHEGRLGPEEAQMEANMVRVRLKEAIGHEPTGEDYDNALRAVEEIKELAANESEFDKNFFHVLQIGNKYFQGAADVLLKVITLGKRPNESDVENVEYHRHMFDDAETNLRQLKEKAEKMAEGQG